MAVYTLARYEVTAEARTDAERAMHELATYVRKELPGASWTIYRDPQRPTHYTSFVRADSPAAEERFHASAGAKAFIAALTPLLAAPIETSYCELVTSSDLAPRRHR
jgi:quinol monooxygenase YgiN